MKRILVQISSTILSNSYFKGFVEGKIYKGDTKLFCLPGLNCYSCPGARFSCPLGSLQAVVGGSEHKLSFYIIGILGLFGTMFGRLICGWLCPFGLVQDLLHKIPVKKFTLPKILRYVKYFILAYFVFIIPIFFTNFLGAGDPAFCKYICPSGTLFAAFPLLYKDQGLRAALGSLFSLKLSILLLIVILSIWFYRIFCKVLCPLGGIYGFFNKVSFYRYEFDREKCIDCKKCEKICKMQVMPYKTPNSGECIRCGDCLSVCPTKAIAKRNIVYDKRDVTQIEI